METQNTLRAAIANKVKKVICLSTYKAAYPITRCTREEMAKADDMGEFYRVPADHRNLNYNLYFSEGETDLAKIEDYHSHNTKRLDVEGVKKLLLTLPLIRKEVFGQDVPQMPG